MAFIQTIFFYLVSTVFFFGPFLRINIFSTSVPIFDVLLTFYVFLLLYSSFRQSNLKYLFLFTIWALISYIFNLKNFSFNLSSFFYLVKLFNICFLLVASQKLTKNQLAYFKYIMFANILFGIIQYIFWPNLYNFKFFGWDPHVSRLTSTFLDPTYTAIIYLLFIIYLFNFKNIFLTFIFVYIPLALTYSRSTLLTIPIISFIHSQIKKKNFLFIKACCVILITFLLLPRQTGESTNLTRTSTIKAKIVNYTEAIQLIKNKPIFGFGYNNLPFVRSNNSQFPNHSLTGFDSSLLTIAATTGMIGLVIFLVFLISVCSNLNYLGKLALISILIHSLFANSLLYSWVIYCFFILFKTKLNNHILS